MEEIKNITNIALVNIGSFHIKGGRLGYNNGPFLPVFQKPLLALSKEEKVSGYILKVLIHILGSVDEKNRINITVAEIAKDIHCSKPTVYKALDTLEKMHIICHIEGRRGGKYELDSKIVNPRLACKGSTLDLDLSTLPLLLKPLENETPLIDDVQIDF